MTTQRNGIFIVMMVLVIGTVSVFPGDPWATDDERGFIFRRHARPGDFRASGSGMIDYDLEKVDLRCIEIAFEISRELKFQSMAYDFLFPPENEPVFCEISYTFQPRAIYDCPGYFDRSLQLNEGHFWPEYLHLVDALDLPELQQPELDY